VSSRVLHALPNKPLSTSLSRRHRYAPPLARRQRRGSAFAEARLAHAELRQQGALNVKPFGLDPPGPHLSHTLEHDKDSYRNPQAENEHARSDEGVSRAGEALPFQRVGISRTGTTLAACQANMPSTCRGDTCPRQVSSSPTVRQASMCTHRRLRTKTPAARPSTRVIGHQAARESPRHADLVPFPERDLEFRDHLSDDDEEDKLRHIDGVSGMRAPVKGA
jgi:hypothetical protein